MYLSVAAECHRQTKLYHGELKRAAFVSGKYWPALSTWAEEGAKNYEKVKIAEEGEW